MTVTSKEVCWWSLKDKGHFEDYDSYEEYQHRNDKKEEPVRIIKESRSEEIQRLKASYAPLPRDFKKLEVHNERKNKQSDKKIKIDF